MKTLNIVLACVAAAIALYFVYKTITD